jgi:hypothetical protein
MKNLYRLIGIIALVAVIGFAFAACDDGSGDNGGGGGGDPIADHLNGTWKASDGSEVTLNKGNFVYSENNKQIMKGTYTASARSISATIAMAVQEIHGDLLNENNDEDIDITFENKWYNKNQVIDAFRKWAKEEYPQLTDAQISTILDGQSGAINAMFPTITGTIDGDTMTIEGDTYTKQGGTTPGGGSSASTFTLTGIPSEYNGKYAAVPSASVIEDDYVWGYQDNELSGVLISNGRVSIPMWILRDDNTQVRWYGNRTAEVVYFAIYDSTVTTGSALLRLRFNSVTFSNGGTNKTWSDGRVY